MRQHFFFPLFGNFLSPKVLFCKALLKYVYVKIENSLESFAKAFL